MDDSYAKVKGGRKPRAPIEQIINRTLEPLTRKGGNSWGGPWPMNQFIIQQSQGIQTPIIHDLVARGFKIIYCRNTNRDLTNAEPQFEGLKTQRFVSKAQNLVEHLRTFGVESFRVAYHHSKSPYVVGGVDKATTIRNLRSALDGAGLAMVSHKSIYEQEYENYKAESFKGWETQVFLFTLAAFLPRLQASRVKWWERLDLVKGYRNWFDERDGKDKIRMVGMPKVAVIVEEPDIKHFDTERMVHEEDVDELKARHHRIVQHDGFYYEQRPENLLFTHGINQGYAQLEHQAPKVIIVTQKRTLARAAYDTLHAQRAVMWWHLTKKAPSRTPLLMSQGPKL